MGNRRQMQRFWGMVAAVPLGVAMFLAPQTADASYEVSSKLTIDQAVAQPVSYYPASKTLAYGQGRASNWPIRRGYFDGKKGFGYDKSYHKHGVWNLKTMSWAMGSTAIKVEGTQRAMTAYARKLRCSDRSGTCVVDKQVEMKAVVETAYKSTYYGQSINGRLGLMTIYCIGTTVCPSWVNNVTSGRAATSSLNSASEYESVDYSYNSVRIGSKVNKVVVETLSGSRN